MGGKQALEAALARVEASAPPAWKNAAQAVLERLAGTGEPFTSDDIWAAIGHPPEPRALGALIRTAAQAGRIHRVGWRISTRPACHCRPVAMWRGISDKAEWD